MKIKRLNIGQQVSINKQAYYVVKINSDNGVITYSFSRSIEGAEELSAVHNEDGALGGIKKSNKPNTVRFIADSINEHCERNELFWAGGLIKDTLTVWQQPLNRALLNRVALNMVEKLEENV